MLVSWHKPAKMFGFRERAEDPRQLFSEAYGTAVMRGTDLTNLRLHMDFNVVEYTTKGLLRVQADDPHIEVPAEATYLGDTKWRCCARRAVPDWRMMNQNDTKVRHYAKDLKGYWNLVWDDKGSHLFHQGRAWYYEPTETIYVLP